MLKNPGKVRQLLSKRAFKEYCINITPTNDNITVFRIRIKDNINTFIASLEGEKNLLKIKRWSVNGESYAHITNITKRLIYLIEETGND